MSQKAEVWYVWRELRTDDVDPTPRLRRIDGEPEARPWPNGMLFSNPEEAMEAKETEAPEEGDKWILCRIEITPVIDPSRLKFLKKDDGGDDGGNGRPHLRVVA